jgi:dTDP-4-dehydrorhamnose reductase
MTKILITGANGQLGNEFRKLAGTRQDLEFIFTDLEELNITIENEVHHFIEKYPVRFLINCAAYTAVDRAEDEPEKAYLLNADAVEWLGRICITHHIQMIHYSTDYVFAGKPGRPYAETDPTNPLSVYGKSKQAGEFCLQKLDTGIIIRTSWLYSSFGHNFVKTILRLAREKHELHVVSDQTGSPTWADDLAQTTLKIIDRFKNKMYHTQYGLYHYSNEGSCSWYDFAEEIIRLAGLKTKIRPVGTSEYPTRAIRPSYSLLNKSLIKSYLGINIPQWQDSLAKCIHEIMNQQ